MQCEQAHQLFDAYLDGELSADLAAELGAHRLRCAECRRALALLEVSGHIIAGDREPVALGGHFSDRLLACMSSRRAMWPRRLRRGITLAAPLAAAAVVAMGFLGFFDTRGGKVAGEKETRSVREPEEFAPLPAGANPDGLDPAAVHSRDEDDPVARALERWIESTRKNLDVTRQRGESLQEALDLTILQWLDILENAKESSKAQDPFPPSQDVDESDSNDPFPSDENGLAEP